MYNYYIYFSVTKNITGTNDTFISIQVCFSSKCKGNERWDKINGKSTSHLFLNSAVWDSKEKYSLERHKNCSTLSIQNLTEEDINKNTYTFFKGPSDKIDTHLNKDLSKYNYLWNLLCILKSLSIEKNLLHKLNYNTYFRSLQYFKLEEIGSSKVIKVVMIVCWCDILF